METDAGCHLSHAGQSFAAKGVIYTLHTVIKVSEKLVRMKLGIWLKKNAIEGEDVFNWRDACHGCCEADVFVI
jgi:rRNA maturation endonuclease Nob1